ncbi:hypothetical protein HD553DRAFT_143594 [Filobasidium floriforme]|uniref:uncharacterized protein n=1 Tax=Filobasidium floriforme TaxID=5210 RepID=UPI001E8D83E3|nr:uncharacterized protein HD553DRAFT_143594 [Filobasidium floriforme]KAH8078649.1 hypothetical protein HD553DRAFT_143594 [Filobasidium floriforme]
MPFSAARIPIQPFTISHSEQEIDDLKTLLRLSPLAIDTYENRSEHAHKFGPSKEWMQDMKSSWMEFDWTEAQAKLNEYPHFIADVHDVDPKTGAEDTFKVHFVGIEHEDPNAVPVVILHGWPGNFYEILPMVRHLQAAGNPPMHIIIPSLIGYSYSSQAPLDRELGTEGCARIMNSLMKGLGYDKYVVQGGDLGAFLGRFMAIRFDECQAVHFNMVPTGPPTILDAVAAPIILSDSDKKGIERGKKFGQEGSAYSAEHRTRPATIGYAVASSPIALLAWVGEKFIQWTDNTPSTEHILTWLSIYWLTKSYPSSIFYYRDPSMRMSIYNRPGANAKDLTKELQGLYVDKPMGYTKFPCELMPVPESWAKGTGNLVHFNEHQVGGHFAATEQPEALSKDFVDFLNIVWPTQGKTGMASAL